VRTLTRALPKSVPTRGEMQLRCWVDLRRAKLGAKSIGFDFAALPGWRAAQWVDD
jgi:hypothetical protein